MHTQCKLCSMHPNASNLFLAQKVSVREIVDVFYFNSTSTFEFLLFLLG